MRALAGRELQLPKRTWGGQATRRRLLAAAGVKIPNELDSASVVPADDVLDAAAVAWPTATPKVKLSPYPREPHPASAWSSGTRRVQRNG